jgi:hypothetical protein
MVTVSVSIDVPSLEKGVHFYSAAFGFSKVADPYPGVIVPITALLHSAVTHSDMVSA